MRVKVSGSIRTHEEVATTRRLSLLLELEKFGDIGEFLSSGMIGFRHGSFWPPHQAKCTRGDEEQSHDLTRRRPEGTSS
jgi:hypothetical protein